MSGQAGAPSAGQAGAQSAGQAGASSAGQAGASSADQPGAIGKAANQSPKTALTILLVGVALIFGPILWAIIFPSGTVLEKLADIDYARGLITFVFAVGTIGIAVLLAVNAISGRSGDAPGRFSRGKEVLAILVGILGTIIGFYFGGGNDEPPSDLTELTATSLEVAETDLRSGQEVTLAFAFFGGEAPYSYSLVFDPEVEGEWDDLETSEHLVFQRIRIPEVQDDQELSIAVTIHDSSGQEAEIDEAIPISPPDGG